MAVENINDKHSIKNLLFNKAIPNYVIPVTGHKVFSCIDCGDKFIFESSYQYHIQRKSVHITYMCRNCGEQKIFFNRCNLIRHIRSHCLKTATINIADLNVEPLPLSHFDMTLLPPEKILKQSSRMETNQPTKNQPRTDIVCYECKQNVAFSGMVYKDRKRHFMQFTNKVYTCPVCLFALPTECGLKAHLRLHLKCPPYYCSECGVQLPNKNIHYPYNHDCEGFKMMRATARLKCPINDKCPFFHPNDYKEHMKQNHLKKVYKCQLCVVACFNEGTMKNHLETHSRDTKSLLFYQCELCPGRLVVHNQIEQHLKCHVNPTIFPCWACGAVCKDVNELLLHHSQKHKDCDLNITQMFPSIMTEYKNLLNKQRIYRVVKRCDQCRKSFIYKCTYGQINTLPNICPYKCFARLQSKIVSDGSESDNSQLICYMCKSEISQDWEEIKKHYATYHKKYRCLDITVKLTRMNITEYIKEDKIKKKKPKVNVNKKNNKNCKNKELKIIDDKKHEPPCNYVEDVHTCNKCDFKCSNKQLLEQHMIIHRDPCMAYQCMECGQSFVVKPSFSTHLLLEHKITNVDDYINSKPCYNANALSKSQQHEKINEPVGENQCSICRDQFENLEDLEKHFRVHGMAFLKKNNTK